MSDKVGDDACRFDGKKSPKKVTIMEKIKFSIKKEYFEMVYRDFKMIGSFHQTETYI